MKKYFTRKNIGWAMTGIIALLIGSAITKLIGAEKAVYMFDANNMSDWRVIVGIGELVAVILFIVPKTMRFGALMLSAYFGGAIVYHMTYTGNDPDLQSFFVPAILLVFIWATAWVRGFNPFGE